LCAMCGGQPYAIAAVTTATSIPRKHATMEKIEDKLNKLDPFASQPATPTAQMSTLQLDSPSDSPEPQDFFDESDDQLAAQLEKATNKLHPTDVHPLDPIARLGVPEDVVQLLRIHAVFTVRQLAQFTSLADIVVEPQRLSLFKQLQLQAQDVVAKATAKPSPAALIDPNTPVYVYHYLSEAVFEQIKEEDRQIKSAYVLFQEYVNCPLEMRNFHPWKRVYYAYLNDAIKWNGARGKHKMDNLTDTDIFSFLVWRAVESFAKTDVTAGPRAIYFSWQRMPAALHADAVEIDQIMGEDLRNPTIVDRYKCVIRVNLSTLLKKYKGHLYRVELKGGILDTNHWLPTTLEEARALGVSEGLWEGFEPGNSFFNSVPHGCIVTPTGTIPYECLDFSWND